MITINSKDRYSRTSDNMIYNIQRNLIGVKAFKIEYIQILYSWYNINSSNNQIRINGSTTISITAGSYTATSLASAISTALIAVDATFTCSFSSTTNKFTIARSTNFTLDLNSSLFTMKRQLGFNGTSQLSGASTYTSDSVINVHNNNSISLHSDV